jgi:glucokinase
VGKIRYYIGIDIGVTKIATLIDTEKMEIIDRVEFPTSGTPTPTKAIEKIIENIDNQLKKYQINEENIISLGISCGGPLSSKRGLIMSPPNLPNWDNVEIVKIFEERYGRKIYLQNDANACALAEWKKGAGKGYENIIFLTFGTGMGAGLILNGKLYTGIDDMAGEVGHIRLEDNGPVGFGKVGSFEGFCSGGGIARLGKSIVEEKVKDGYDGKLKKLVEENKLTTKDIAIEGRLGDKVALEILDISAEKLGKGLSILIDILNPEAIVIGSIYTRAEDLFKGKMEEVLKRETLSISLNRCEILKAKLGEKIGDYGALFTATGEY